MQLAGQICTHCFNRFSNPAAISRPALLRRQAGALASAGYVCVKGVAGEERGGCLNGAVAWDAHLEASGDIEEGAAGVPLI